MSSVVCLFVHGAFSGEQLAAALQAHIEDPLRAAWEQDGTPYWGFPFNGHHTSIGTNEYEDDDYDPERYPLVISFNNPVSEEGESLEQWIERTWLQWLPWLVEAGATELLLVPDFAEPVRHWRRPT